jgi:hypothetical protein
MEQKRFRKFCLYQIRLIEEQLRAIRNVQLNETLYVNQQNSILQNKDLSTIINEVPKKTEIIINLSENNLISLFIKREKQKESYMSLKTNGFDQLPTKSYNEKDTLKKTLNLTVNNEENSSHHRLSGKRFECLIIRTFKHS